MPVVLAESRTALAGFADNRTVRVVILTGAGKKFCTGSDMGRFLDLAASDAVNELATIRLAFNALPDCAVPVFAAVNGAALGTGMVLAVRCDIWIASESTTFCIAGDQGRRHERHSKRSADRASTGNSRADCISKPSGYGFWQIGVSSGSR